LNVVGANGGMWRFCDTPSANFASPSRGLVCVTKFTTPGASEATRATWSISPNP
jgi:hypothetical protein